MFGHDALPSRIYSYGALAPLGEGLTQVREQLWLAHRYRNKLVELERARRDAVDECLRTYYPGLEYLRQQWEEAEASLEEIEAVATQANISACSKDAAKSMRTELREARRLRKEARRAYQEAKKPAYTDPVVLAALAIVEEEDLESRKAARAECNLYWGTYLSIEQAAKSFRKGPPPRFRAWKGEGKLAVQIQKGMTAAELLSGLDNRLGMQMFAPGDRLDREGNLISSDQPLYDQHQREIPRANPNSRRSQRNRRALVSFRIGSVNRQPVFAGVPIVYHRPLPVNSEVKWAYLICRKVASHYQWKLQLVISRAEGFPLEDAASEGAVGIDVGWRRHPDGNLRIAYAVGDDGYEEELFLPVARIEEGWEKVEHIRSERDRAFDTIRAELLIFLAQLQEQAPDWLLEATDTLSRWRSPGRLAMLTLRWQDRWIASANQQHPPLPACRFEGDTEMVEHLEQWRKQDKLRWEEEANLRQKTIAWRENLYRDFAVRLRRRYRLAVLEKIDWRKLTVTPAIGEEDAASPRWRFIAAPGRLHEILKESFAETLMHPAERTTTGCNACRQQGQTYYWSDDPNYNPKVHLHHTCGRCGTREDQDRNAALNLLDAASSEVMS